MVANHGDEAFNSQTGSQDFGGKLKAIPLRLLVISMWLYCLSKIRLQNFQHIENFNGVSASTASPVQFITNDHKVTVTCA